MTLAMNGYHTATREIVARVRKAWPEHERFLEQRFGPPTDSHAEFCEQVAGRILRIIDDRIDRAIDNYRWTCLMMLEEEFAFRRTGRYRHSGFADARAAVYDNEAFMARYTDGLLLSQLLWANHAGAIESYRSRFLPWLGPDADVLEVGPGHGLLLAMAAERSPRTVTGWDVSATSLAATRRALDTMGIGAITLEHVDLLDASVTGRFDGIVASELLEHLDRPAEALAKLRQVVRPSGRLFLNIPVNSPAPDHIYLWRTPEEVFDFVTAAGLDVLMARAFPMTGKSEAQARAQSLTLSCVLICARPADEAGDR
jgi:2-polyprenyl-3-methyl-5-hydroxy-6-metoxy-1,4-benzoquinol methylase